MPLNIEGLELYISLRKCIPCKGCIEICFNSAKGGDGPCIINKVSVVTSDTGRFMDFL